MASLNKVQLIGNLGADPETRYTPSGDPITNIRIATTDRWRDKASGEMRAANEISASIPELTLPELRADIDEAMARFRMGGG